MIGLLSRGILLRHTLIGRPFCTKPKFLRNKELKYESKLTEIKEFVLNKSFESNGNINWEQMVSHLVEQKLVHKRNFEVDLMSAFLLNTETISQIDKKLIQSLIKFLKAVPNLLNNNSIAASRYCHFISHFHQYIEESDIEMIRRTTDQLITKYTENRLSVDILNPTLIGLSNSSKDNCLHSIKLLDQIKGTDFVVIQQIIESALNFQLINESLDLMEKYSDIKLNEKLITKIINALSEHKSTPNQNIRLLRILSKNLIVFDSDLMPKIITIMENYSFKTNLSSIRPNGLCLKCDQTLGTISGEEQITLSKDFRSIVFNKENDLLIKSFPEYERELKQFDKFLQNITSERPLDLVIDGLNLAFATTSIVVEDKKNLRKYTRKYPVDAIDANIVEMLTKNNIEKYENVLIVGRSHMKSWKRLNQFLFGQRQRISRFYTMNKTQDDCYILYATLKNPNTFLISNDLYRDFCEKMSKKGIIFERWLKTHQISLIINDKQLVFPDRFDHKMHISKDEKTIHIPFHSNNKKIDWICFQKF